MARSTTCSPPANAAASPYGLCCAIIDDATGSVEWLMAQHSVGRSGSAAAQRAPSSILGGEEFLSQISPTG